MIKISGECTDTGDCVAENHKTAMNSLQCVRKLKQRQTMFGKLQNISHSRNDVNYYATELKQAEEEADTCRWVFIIKVE